MKQFSTSFCTLLLLALQVGAQSTLVPYNQDYQHWVERYEIKRGKFAEHLMLSIKLLERRGVAALADSILKENRLKLNKTDRFNLFYLLNDNAEWADTTHDKSKRPILGIFYQYTPDLYRADVRDFNLHINPVFHLGMGVATGSENRPFLNTRGAEMRGLIARRVGFYTYLADNIMLFPNYVMDYIGTRNAVPGEGFWKTRTESGVLDNTGVAVLTARGYVAFDIIKNIMSFQLGHDKQFYGNGYRSLILSDFSANYLFARFNTRVWKVNYTNSYTQLTADAVGTNRVYPKKYAVFHHLGINITDNLNVGLFESVVYGRPDGYKNDTFDLSYLNPIIFYRWVEQQVGSADNSIIGFDWRWNFLRQFQLYGQFVLDEFKLSEARAGEGWWGNKHGIQAGVKYVDAWGIKNLDLQAEYNAVRPYTYSHFIDESLSNHAHFNQPLAHPLGANFREWIGIVRYQPLPRLMLSGKLIYAQQGLDRPGENWGSNILLDNTTRQQEYGNRIGQGLATTLLFGDFTASYQLKHNLFIDFKQVLRRLQSEDTTRNNNLSFTSLAIRLNIAQRLHEF
ncbi:MAG: hypothetical protein RMJ87_01705 [Cytophagales bacterium]|nr:capsule assembly Wzi family protein [Bernardetiaceae bacterium]MDW8203718.1 hypothetical protein [Cytophagales bacterium]